ncbi:hypothetical protein V496_10591 [Pseudogymnoascus sp. VKM F-4515 (FW-2607)]|nr:hypothetical protein V496_10591 [Pseudogymnoascus sp. VKM F-4515 (FW-2607)]KFY92115.1 hypothetical protein V498_05154 [Pseudogymnoascus sp. VKM F-4517 (FW-2822)]
MSLEPSFEDRRDYEDAERGFIAKLEPGIIKNGEGRTVWDIDQFNFIFDECPETVNPKLWRQGQLNSKQGLFEITSGIYQIRAFDLSNMTIIEGKEGILIIDPLVSCECAAAGLELYQKHRGIRKVTGMIYSHSHGDHYMGAGGVLPLEKHDRPDIPIIAPEGFIEAIISESILAGPAMRQRAAFMYGRALERGPKGHVGAGLGMGSSTGSTSLIPPNILIQETGEEHIVDGIRMVFQMVPDAEAPAEINFHFPDFKTLCIPETATNCMHNIVTLRGAQVRDAKAWSKYLDEAVVLFGNESDILIGSHNWPTWGRKELTDRLVEQRDMYGYLHDQTVRMMNLGMTGIEIAETIKLPPRIAQAWHCQGYYGSVSHNVKGIYQKYMTWFDGNPAHLWKHPRTSEGEKYVECMGGLDGICATAQKYHDNGDYRFSATLLDHAVAAYPSHEPAKMQLALTYEKLGFGAENAVWRNFYLTAAQQLRTGKVAGMVAGGQTSLGPNLKVGQWFDIMSVQINGELAGDLSLVVDFNIPEEKQKWRLILSNGVLTHRCYSSTATVVGKADLELTLPRLAILEALRGNKVEATEQKGNLEDLQKLVALTNVEYNSARGPSQL